GCGLLLGCGSESSPGRAGGEPKGGDVPEGTGFVSVEDGRESGDGEFSGGTGGESRRAVRRECADHSSAAGEDRFDDGAGERVHGTAGRSWRAVCACSGFG